VRLRRILEFEVVSRKIAAKRTMKGPPGAGHPSENAAGDRDALLAARG
jgi:hypothetical protein